jgi:hypothetical protein
MFIVVKHVQPAVWSKLRPALRLTIMTGLVTGLFSILLVAGGTQFFGFNLASFAASHFSVGASAWQTLFGHDTGTPKIAPAQTHSGAQAVEAFQQTNEPQVKLVSTSAAPGSRVSVPVEFNAEGTENSLAFSLSYDAAALSQPRVTLAEELLRQAPGATLEISGKDATAGRLGVVITLPDGQPFAAGARKLLSLEFTVSSEMNAVTLPLVFGDEPVARRVADTHAQARATRFVNGLIAIVPGLEADVAPRQSGGNELLSVADWALAGRLVAGLETVNQGAEFQRVDSAPRASLGDGQLTIGDWVQAGRYAVGLDAPVAAGGPTAPVTAEPGNSLPTAQVLAEQQQTRTVRIVPATFERGETEMAKVELNALGTEFAVGFTLNFDATQLNFVSAVAGLDTPQGATIIVNNNDAANGKVIINLSLPFGQQFAAGTRQILILNFSVPTTSTLNATTIGFTNGAVVDDQAATLPATFTAGVITLIPTIVAGPPSLTSLNPDVVLVGGANFSLTVNGANLSNGSTVRVNGSDRFTEFVSAAQLRATLLATDILETGPLGITVHTPEGVTTNALTLNVNNPAPTLTSLSPTSASLNSPALTLIVTGSNFVPGAQIKFNNVNRTTTYLSNSQLTALIPSSQLNTAGTYDVLVTNPLPGGGASNTLTFTVSAPKPIPRTTSISPTSVQAGSPTFTLTVNGSGFVSESAVRWNGELRTTTFVSSTQLTTEIAASDIAEIGNVSVTVFNSPPGGGVSNAQILTIVQPPNPVPAITSLNPASVAAGGPAFTLSVTGTGFVQTSVVRFNGQDRATTYVSATEVRAALTAADIANGGTANIRVFNPAPGGGQSPETPLTITFAAPTITLISPSSIVAGGAAFTLSVTGANFAPNSVLRWNGEPRPTTVVSATELTAQIPAADIANVGTATITVFSPVANAASNEVSFTINQSQRPIPRLTLLIPDTTTAGGTAFELALQGSNFVSDSVVRWNGQARPTTFVNSTQVTAQLTAADIASTGTASVTVFTPAPGGGESNPLTFSITQAPNPIPAITSLNPATAAAGTNGLALTINGSGFVAASVVRLNGNGETRPSTFVNATQLTVQLTAADLATAGTLTLTVVNPAPGGGTSNSVTLNINNAVPVITALNPNIVAEGSQAQTLTVVGTGFVRGSQVLVEGTARLTSYISETQLSIQLLANELAAVGTLQIQVANPAPGGGVSNALPLEIRKRNPLPRIASLNPEAATAGGPGFTLIVNGTGFVPGSVVRFNGLDRQTDFGSENLIVAQIPASDIAAGGMVAVAVVNPAPGGGTSGAVQFSITNPAPRITSINPDAVVAGSGAQTLVLNGSGFTANSVVRFNGSEVTTVYITASQLSAQLPASAIVTGGVFPVTVFNPAPGGGTSSAFSFTVTNPAPVAVQLLPNGAAAGSPSFALTVLGTGFTPASVVRWNGQDRLTTFGGQTQLTAVINMIDVAQIGTAQITVFTPAPGGGTSNALVFNIKDEPNPVPTLATLNPDKAFAGGAPFTLTITGTDFVAGSRVLWNGEARPTAYLSATQIAAQVTAADIANAATVSITVNNPAPGGGTSNALPFGIVPPPNPTPVIGSLAPNAAFAGAAALVMTINGSGFINESVARWNGADRATVRVNANQLTVQLSAADLAQGGVAQVTVANPPSVSGGGGVSNEAPFTIRQLPAAQIALTPSAPTTNDSITAQLSGMWPDGCIPQNPQVTIVGNEVRISTANPSQVCTATVTPWSLNVPFGPLPAAGNYLLRVFYTSPLGQAVIGQTSFTVVNGKPTLTGLAPGMAVAGSPSLSIAVNGLGFLNGAIVRVNGAERLTTFVNPTQLTALLTEADLLSGTLLQITAVNPAPGGGESNMAFFTVNNPQPSLSAINPAIISAGNGAFTLTVSGAGFVPGAVVRWNGANRQTTYISNTSLSAVIPAADVEASGTASITVFNPAPGGGPSTAVTFTIDSAPQCQTICFQSPQYYLLNMSRLPGGSIIIGGVNFNQPVSIQSYLAEVKRTLQGGRSSLAQLNAEFVAAQMSLIAASGPFGSSAVMSGVLRCYGLSFGQLQLSNGFSLSVNTTLGELIAQAQLAINENRDADMLELARIFDLVNGNEPTTRCGGSNLNTTGN